MEEKEKELEWWELPPIEPSIPITNYQVCQLLNDLNQRFGEPAVPNKEADDLDTRCTNQGRLAEEGKNETE